MRRTLRLGLAGARCGEITMGTQVEKWHVFQQVTRRQMRKSNAPRRALIHPVEEIRRLPTPQGASPRPFRSQEEINTRFRLDANPIKRNIARKFSLGMGTRNAHRQTENIASSCPVGAFS
tara:strand:+ start:151 stop:510 length:360 start_codon:yes stop_codon:yes gene_type:complete